MRIELLFLQNNTPFGLTCPWWWIFSLGAFILGLLLGWWLWYHFKKKVDELNEEVHGYQAKLANMEKDYMGLKYQHDELQKEYDKLKASLRHCEADNAILQGKIDKLMAEGGDPGIVTGRGLSGEVDYSAIFGQENLQIVEGIGPKVEELLKKGGIGTLAALATASADDLREILEKGGANFRLQDPTTWPKQAMKAAEGRWADLIQYQKTLDTGREGVGDGDTPSKVEKLAAKLLGFSTNPEDLKIVEGIGPKIEKLLKDAGIPNLASLAATSVDKLKEILAGAGESFRLADPGTWPKQAELAAAGNWKELSEYQEFLDGGKDPS